MPLKALLTSQAEVDALPEALRGLYVETNGKFVLDIDDVAALPKVAEINSRLAEFRQNNIGLTAKVGELDALKAQIEKFKDVDPEEYRRLKAEFEKLPGKGKGADGKDTDIAALIAAQVAAQVGPLKAALDAEKAERSKAQQRADSAALREAIAAVATKKGVKATALKHVLREAEDVFQVVNGEVKAREGRFSAENAGNPLTADEWLGSLAKSDDYLFEPTQGSGAPPRPGQPRAGVRTITADEMSKPGNLEKVAKGELIVQ